MSRKLRILVADDHEIVRKGIKQILLEEFSFSEIAEVSDTPSLVSKALSESWDIIISDLAMPGGGGLDAIRKIHQQKPDQRILIVSIYPEEQYAIRAIRTGACGFLNKDAATDELIKAIHTILSGRKYIHPSLADKISKTHRIEAGLLPHDLLSEREMQVMLKLASGLSVSEIARELTLTNSAVNTYRTRVLEKMGMSSNAELMKYVIENKLDKQAGT